jgi:hypothetical protein
MLTNAGSPDHDKPYYFIEVRIPIDRLDLLAKQGLIRDFTSVVLNGHPIGIRRFGER